MINLNFASNLNVLADQAIDQLKSAWTDPFTAPAIVFPDKKIEQWFRLRWVSKYGAIGNLNAKTIDAFLWESLQPDENQKLLTDDILQSVILAYFLENAKTLPEQCLTYLQKTGEKDIYEVGVKGIDEAKAFDLSKKLSSLFRDYELTRPEILDYWKDGELRDFFDLKSQASKEEWQRNIYSAVFHKGTENRSYFQKVFDKVNADNGTQLQYMTLPYWFNVKKDCLKDCAGKGFFIFGLSNVGHFYHRVLKEMSDAGAMIYAFIQNPCSEFWEDSADYKSVQYNADLDEYGNCPADENPLLIRFGKSGRENVRTWNQLVDYDIAPIPKKEMYDSVLHAAQSLVLNRKCNLDDLDPAVPRLEKDGSFVISAAPSRIREVEELHTQICKILERGGKANDILVLAPNLDDYHAAIIQVFESSGYKKGVPYKILDSKDGESFTLEALNTLLDIRNTGNFNREHLLSLMGNPVVQATRGISQIDVENYQGILNAVPAYRHKDTEDAFSWSRAIKRLLLSKWMDKPFGNIVPFASMETSDERSLSRFISMLDDLEKLSQSSDKTAVKGETELNELADNLFMWLRNSEEVSALSGLRLAIHSLKLIFASGVGEIPFKIVYHSLKQAIGNTKVSSDKLFIDGISFMKLMPNRIVPARHLFLLGVGMEQYPGANDDSSLDLRIVAGRKLGDDNNIDKNKYVFLCQLMSAEESFHISYVNQNLKKAAELEPSSVVVELFDFINRSILKNPCEMKSFCVNRKLDEDRTYDEIYTRRSFRNFCIANRITAASDNDYTVILREQKEDKNKVVITARQLKKFLENPFEFQVTVSLGLRDEDENVSRESYEPISASYLSQYKINHQSVDQYLRTGQKDFDFTQSENEGVLPAAPFNEKVKEQLRNLLQFQIEILSEICGESVLNEKPLKLSVELEKNVILETEIKSFYRNGSTIILFDPSHETIGKVEKVKKHLQMYIQGLMLLACGECKSVSSVVLFSNGIQKARIDLDNDSAMQRLLEIYKLAYGEKFRMLLPVDFVWKAIKESDSDKRAKLFKKSFRTFTEGDYAEYKSQYFPLFKIFDYRDCQFTNEWLERDLQMGVEKMEKLFCGISLE